MMFDLFYKEWALAAPSVDLMFIFMGALVLVPAYPYGMVFFFGMLAVFFSLPIRTGKQRFFLHRSAAVG